VKLRSMLAVPMAAIMLITVLLVTVLSAGSIRSWREGQDAIVRMEQLRQLLVLQEVLGLERGPTISALTSRSAVTPELGAAVAANRLASDRCLRDLAALPGLSDRIGRILAELSAAVTASRATADTAIRQPPQQRSAGDIAAAVGKMAALPPLLFPAEDQTLAEISAADPAVAPLLTATRAASDLRLYAGSIISKFAGVTSKGGFITMPDISMIRIQQGQVIELHRLLLASISLANAGEPSRDVVEAMEQHYFGAAQRLIDWLVAGAIDNGQFSMTPAALLAEYEPSLRVLVAVRDRLFVLTHQAIVADQAARLDRLEATAAAGGAVLLAVLAALLMLHRWIILPLAELAAMIIRLAQGDRSVRLAARHGSREIAELASAIEVLRVATIEADAAAARRRVELQRWTAQLRQVLDTIDLMQARAATITDVLPALLEQLAALGQDDDDAMPALAAAVAAARAGIAVLRSSSGQLDAALQRMHSVGDGEDIRFEELVAAMDEVARVVTAIQEAVNDLPQITLSAICDLSARTNRFDRPERGSAQAVHERILAQVQEMAAAAGGLQSALSQATHGLGELARLRA
jgi:hypothetical protein